MVLIVNDQSEMLQTRFIKQEIKRNSDLVF